MSDNEVAEFFGSNTEEYSAGLKEGSNEKIEFIYETFSDENELRVLDVGCGSGLFADKMSEILDTDYVCGTEIAEEMFSREAANVGFLLADGRDLPFQSETFNLIHMDTVLHHIVGESRGKSKEAAKNALGEIFRVLNPGGYILLTERVQKGRVVSDKSLSTAIFYGLKYGSKLLHPFHPQIHRNQPPICFYTFDEIEAMIGQKSGCVIEKDIFPHPSSHPLEKPFRSTSLRVTFYIRKC